jgi:HD superfamily phosphohydrolase
MPALDPVLRLSLSHAPFDPAASELWEPLWGIRVSLTPCERALLQTPALRRLRFVHHFGAAGLLLPPHYSRLEHILGVFALTAHFCPDDEPLRLAALLHDVGHAPFSHAAEAIPGVDHHVFGRRLIAGEPIVGILRQHGPEAIIGLIEGRPPNPVRINNGRLHLDHLDFFVRDPFYCGLHVPAPADILARLWLDGPNVATDLAMGEHLARRIALEARLFLTPADLGASAVVGRLLIRAAERGIIDPQQLIKMTDGEVLEAVARSGDWELCDLLDLVRFRSHAIQVRRLAAGESPPEGALIVDRHKLYLAQPLVDGRPVGEVSAEAGEILSSAAELAGRYAVTWS